MQIRSEASRDKAREVQIGNCVQAYLAKVAMLHRMTAPRILSIDAASQRLGRMMICLQDKVVQMSVVMGRNIASN